MPLSAITSQAIATRDDLQNNASSSEASSAKTSNVKTDLATRIKENNFFENFLSRSTKSNKVEAKNLETRLVDIKQKASLVMNHPLPSVVKDYVSEIKSFITDVKDHAYEHQKNDKNLFEKMNLIDEKLVEISDKLLEEQKKEIDLVASLGDLQGLLVDFYI